MFSKKSMHRDLPQGLAIDLYRAYVEKFHVMDTYYRKFYVAYDQGEASELLKKIKERVENLYTSWYMGQLSSHWSQAVQADYESQLVVARCDESAELLFDVCTTAGAGW